MGKEQITPEIYETTLRYLKDRIRVYEVFADNAQKAETKMKYMAMKGDCENILRKFTDHYTHRKSRRKKNQVQTGAADE